MSVTSLLKIKIDDSDGEVLIQFAAYMLEDAEENPIRGNLYEQELQKTSYPDVYLVEKIIDRRKRNGIAEVRVKWLGFDKPTWINKNDVL